MTNGAESTDEQIAIQARANSVKQLCDLYRVVIAIAVGIAFHGIVEESLNPESFDLSRWRLFLIFVITIVPFFHGAVRHLYATYVEQDASGRVKNWAILIDYWLLFLQGGVFIGLASSTPYQAAFHALFMIVLGIDIVWGVLAAIGFAGTASQAAEIKWAKLNALFFVPLVLLFLFAEALVENGVTDEVIGWTFLVLAFTRTVLDYAWNIKFYCPGPEDRW